MRRRDFTTGILGAALWPLAVAQAQRPEKLPRVGVLTTSPPADNRISQAFLGELRRLGWVEGQNVTIEWKVTAGQIERFDTLAAELVRTGADVIVAPNPNATLAARRATASIPIVMINTPDPVQLGIVDSLARPGGNVTGTSSLSADVSAKQVQLMKELLPRMSRLVVIAVVTNPWHRYAIAAIEPAAHSLGVEIVVVTAHEPGDFERSFADIARDRSQAALVLADPMSFFHRGSLAELGIRYRIPTAYGLREYAEAGGLMSYWADLGALYQRTAAYVDKLLRGEKPENLPIEQPTKYELVINLKTANALGIEVPPALLARADEVIE
jgi:putative tryptophan/tyrosine transport system substrate-binding protein